LGLVICRGLVEKMGGKIWFETEAGVGSTFRFFFLAEEGHAQEQKTLNPLSGFDAGFSLRHPLKILLVEDNRTNQIVALGLLDRMGYKVDVADDGFEAIHRTTESEYDLILMDCHMPGLDGFEATRQIRSRFGVGGGPRIVALTASLSEQDIESCRTSGMDGFLGKPIAISELAKVLAESRSSVVPLSKVDLKDDSKLNSKPVFDRSAFELNFAGMEDLAIEAVESFLQQQVVLMAAIEQAVAAQDSKALELAAHTFKVPSQTSMQSQPGREPKL
jgi:CheY-like chemotaxis protein